MFDNPQREDGSRTLNLDADEVAVGRRLFRDGTSEYQINNTIARLKDIRELFLDTGVGVDAYSVIEQGRVAALLEANPEERRLIFEEAAGISKFKARKKEAQRKLEKVDQNLLRVNDIVEEVEKRLRSVKIQAGRARTFQEHHHAAVGTAAEPRAAGISHASSRSLSELDAKHEDAQVPPGRCRRRSGPQAERPGRKTPSKLDALTQQRQQLEYELVQAGAQMQSARQRQQYARQQLQQMAEQIARPITADQAAAEQKLAEVARIAGRPKPKRWRSLTAELEEHRQQIDQRQAAFRDGQLQLNQTNQQIEQAQGRRSST